MSSEGKIPQSFVNQIGVLWRILNKAYGRELPERLENQRFCPQFWAVFIAFVLFIGIPVALGFLVRWARKKKPLLVSHLPSGPAFPKWTLPKPMKRGMAGLYLALAWVFVGFMVYSELPFLGWWVILWGFPALLGAIAVIGGIIISIVLGAFIALTSENSLGTSLRFLPVALWVGTKMLYKKACPIVTYA